MNMLQVINPRPPAGEFRLNRPAYDRFRPFRRIEQFPKITGKPASLRDPSSYRLPDFQVHFRTPVFVAGLDPPDRLPGDQFIPAFTKTSERFEYKVEVLAMPHEHGVLCRPHHDHAQYLPSNTERARCACGPDVDAVVVHHHIAPDRVG